MFFILERLWFASGLEGHGRGTRYSICDFGRELAFLDIPPVNQQFRDWMSRKAATEPWMANLILGSKGHVFRACMKRHDFETRKT